MKKFAVIVAGGMGSRMKTTLPKQFLVLHKKPVLFYAIEAFLKAYEDCNVIVVLPKTHMDAGKDIIQNYFRDKPVKVALGGATRFHSVQNGLKEVEEGSIVFVHDAVRCTISKELIRRCYLGALEYGSAVPVIDCKDSVRLLTDEGNMPLNRTNVKLVQTPQTFKASILLPAFDTAYDEKFTDEATVAEAFGIPIHLVPGEENNIKITHHVDLELAENILNERNG